MIARAAALFGRALDFIRAPAPPVLPPYHAERAPLEAATRKAIFYGVLAFLGLVYGFLYVLFPPSWLLYLIAPIGIIALFVIWALPDRDTAPVVLLERIYWGFWITMILWPNYLALALPGLPWITVNRLFGGPLLLILLIAVSTSQRFRDELKAPLSAIPLLWKMVAGFAFIQIATIFLSATLSTTLNRVINFQLIWTSVFFVSAYVFMRPGRIELWARLLCLMGVITASIGLIEMRYQHVLWANHIPTFLKIEDEAVQRVLAGAFRGLDYRVVSTFMISLSMAEYLALVSPFLIHLFVLTRKPIVRVLLVVADVIILTAIIETQARLGMVGFLLAHSVYGLLWAVRRWRSDRASLFGPALTLAYPALLAIFFGLVLAIGRLRVMVLGGGQHQASNDARGAQFDMAPAVIGANPLGYGSGRAGTVLGYVNPGGEGTIDTYILSVVLDYGVIGFILFYGMLLVAFLYSAKLSSEQHDDELSYAIPVSICFAVFFTIKMVLSQESNNPIMFMLLGMTCAMVYRANQAKAAAPGQT